MKKLIKFGKMLDKLTIISLHLCHHKITSQLLQFLAQLVLHFGDALCNPNRLIGAQVVRSESTVEFDDIGVQIEDVEELKSFSELHDLF